jgi:ABC-type Fe3+-hydroxamate transport system substrate-binding protein
MPLFEDQAGRTIVLDKLPQRIISIVPSQTELLYDLGLDKEVIGITKFCVHPEKWFRNKTRVGGTKQLNIEKIHELRPDLIIANKEENVKEQVEELEKHYPVWISDVNNLEDARHMIHAIGKIVGKEQSSLEMIGNIKSNFQKPDSRLTTNDSRLKTCYLIWHDPYMTIGGDTFINSMLEAAGFENVFKNQCRYPEITIETIRQENIDLILLSSEPFPFKEKHIDELKTAGIKAQCLLVNGEIFSWYGSRMLKAPAYFLSLREKIDALSNKNVHGIH